MAGELQLSFATGRTVYALIRNAAGQIWNTSGGTGAFVAYASTFYPSFTIALTEQGSSGGGYYVGNVPAAVPAGSLAIVGKNQLGGSAVDADPTIATGNLEWNGSSIAALSDTATSGQIGQFSPIRIFKGQSVNNFPFKLVSSLDHVTPFTSGVCSGQISRDGGIFGVLQSGNVSEVGLGWYAVNLTSGDLNANTIALTFSANGISGGQSDSRDFAIVTQRTSGG